MKLNNRQNLVYAAVFLMAVFCRWPALQSWWCMDDWGQLARAAGLIAPETHWSARWLSQDLWWSITWPLLGLNTVGHAVVRLFLHGLAAVLVARLGCRATGRASTGLLAGGLFGATPIAFTVLYWASGIQELLAGVLVLAAVERWWSGCRGYVFGTVMLGAASILAKESGLGLPVFLAAHIIWQRRDRAAGSRRWEWLGIGVLALVVGLESFFVLNSFATGPTDAYRMGGLVTILGNVGIFGWWLATPGPLFVSQMTWTHAGVGSLLFGIWGTWGWWNWRRGRRLALTALVGALLSLGPSLVLVQQSHAYLAYVAAAGLSLTLAELWPSRWLPRPWQPFAFLVALGIVGAWNMDTRLNNLNADGLPADPVVRAATIARDSARDIRAQIPPGEKAQPLRLILLQPPLRRAEVLESERRGDRYVKPTFRYRALGGDLGPRLLVGPGAEVVWSNGLLRAPLEAQVLCETAVGFDAWGNTWSALLYATVSDIMLGNFERAEQELSRALMVNESLELFIYDSRQLEVPRKLLLQQGKAYQRWAVQQNAIGETTAKNSELAAEKLRLLLDMVWQGNR